MTTADAPKMLSPEQIVPGCDYDALWTTAFAAYDDSGRLWQDVAADLDANLAAAAQDGEDWRCRALQAERFGDLTKARADRAEVALVAAQEALFDMREGWRYIRDHYGDLYGVGWDRAQNKADAALATIAALAQTGEPTK